MSAFTVRQEKARQKQKESGGKCGLCTQVLTLSKKRQRDFYDAMIDRKITNEIIHAVLDDWGVDTSVTVVSRHRAGKGTAAEHMLTLKKVILGE